MKMSPFCKVTDKILYQGFGFIAVSVIAIFQILPLKVWANDLVIPFEMPQPSFFGLAVGAYPDYFGSDDNAVGAIPIGRAPLGGERYISLIATDVRINLLNSSCWRLGPEIFYRFGRDDVDDEVVSRMHEIDNSTDLGLFGGYSWKDPQEIRKQAGFNVWGLWDVSGVHDGWTAGVSVYGMYPVARPVTIAVGAGTTYGSEEYMDAYFGVTETDSMTSGLLPYTADGGMRDARGWVAFILHLSPKWHTSIGLLYSRMLGDATDSPIVAERGTEDQFIYGAGVLYSW